MKTLYFLPGLILILCANAAAVPAFPGAEGYGATATGGRGGVVYEVTNLDDSGAGSLRDALNHNTTRTIVFRVSGTIHLYSNLSLKYGNVTIAGQTAPGDGICIANGTLYAGYDNVIIRYIRCRLGDEWPDGSDNDDTDAMWGRYGDRIILDHVTASWSVDECMSFYHNTNFTGQWCLISESLRYSHHEKGPHGYGGIWGSNYSTCHHNLLAHHSSRNPRFASGCGNTDYRNNVIYNWGYNSCYGGEKVEPGDSRFVFSNINMVANYYKPGPATQSGQVSYRIANPSYRDVKTDYGQWYVADNFMVGNATVTADNWNGGVQPQGGSGDIPLLKLADPWPAMAINQQTAEEAYNLVLDNAGCSKVRDSVDTRIINEVATGTATYGGQTGAGTGIIDSQDQVGGWPTLNSLPAPTDTDQDGMPDAWELLHGLNPSDAADRNGDYNGDGYTNLEKYINSLCPDPYGIDYFAPTPDPMTWAIAPYASDACSISMMATIADDPCGVEYYFANQTDANHDSTWQDSPIYTDTNLAHNTSYTYQVQARDKSSNQNETVWSVEASATTDLEYTCTEWIASDLYVDCQVDLTDYAILANALAEEAAGFDLDGDGTLDFDDIAEFALDWLTCNRDPGEQCWQ